MPRWPYSMLFLAAVLARAQTPADSSVHALCDSHADALLGALDAAHYDIATTDFDDALRARYSAEKLRKDYEGLPSKYGKMLGRGRPHLGDISEHTVVLTPLIFERGTLTAEVRCNAEGSVSDLRLVPTQVMSTP
ncbi:MAG TPA: hypothetical protein VGO25_10340 [Rhodanobacteraceae bacterium]|nr:hypothetical protein [Rhodanobacteraceae bacterium]